MISAGAVTVTTVVAVDPAAAFDVFTSDVDSWWRRGPRFRFRADAVGTMRFEPGVGGRLVELYDTAAEDAYEVGRVLVWEPARRLVFEFRALAFEADETTEVDVRFEAVAAGTRVTVEHRGWDTLRPDHPVRSGLEGTAFTGMIGVWWGDLLVSAARHAAGRQPRTG